jgi:hypothetical protein
MPWFQDTHLIWLYIIICNINTYIYIYITVPVDRVQILLKKSDTEINLTKGLTLTRC